MRPPVRLSRRALLAAGGSALISMAVAGRAIVAIPASATFDLRAPGGRIVTVSEWRPRRRAKGVILFSHGAASSPSFYTAIIAPMAAAGYRVLAPLHVDSTAHPRTREFPGLASWKARLEDMAALIAYIGDTPYVAVGHSYGGLIALTLGGAAAVPPDGWQGPLTPRRARAVVALSPPAPVPVLCTQEGYAAMAVPALVQTGTKDIVPGMGSQAQDGWVGHLVPFSAPPPRGNLYGMLLEGVDHYFGGLICRYDRPGPPQTAQLEQANRIVGLFLDGFGHDAGTGARSIDAALSDDLPVRLTRR